MRLVERHIVKDNRFEDICLKSGLLYNYALFNVRQGIFDGNYLKEYEFSTKLCKTIHLGSNPGLTSYLQFFSGVITNRCMGFLVHLLFYQSESFQQYE